MVDVLGMTSEPVDGGTMPQSEGCRSEDFKGDWVANARTELREKSSSVAIETNACCYKGRGTD